MPEPAQLPAPRLAQLILDNVTQAPEHFEMADWFDGPVNKIRPGDDLCGTTMCVAGWAAHLTGWTLIDNIVGVEVTRQWNGHGITECTSVYAEKDGMRRTIADVAADALDLGSDYGLFHGTADDALACLAEIARR